MSYFASRVGARGIIFGESKVAGQAGHVWNIVNQNGVVRVLDGQTGQEASLLFDEFNNLRILVTN
jgi:filamentous hemagglutinin